MSIADYLEPFSPDCNISIVGPFHPDPFIADEPVIFVDRGTCARRNNEGLSVGDGDSFPGKLDIALNPDKDFSDLAFVLDAIPRQYSMVTLIGFLGGRRDHEYFNLGAAQRFLINRDGPARICFEDAIFGYSSGRWEFRRMGCFSIAAVEPVLLTLAGDCRYPLPDKTRFSALSSLGLSNHGSGTIYMHNDGPVFVIFEDSD